MSDSILNVKNLSIAFQNDREEQIAVNGISYSLNKGETLGIVGESGSGKSVSSMALVQLLPTPPAIYKDGVIEYGDEKINLLRLDEKAIRAYRGKEVAMIFQEPMTSLNPSHRCGAQVAEMLILHTSWSKEEIKNYVLELFEKVKLPDPNRIYRSYPHELSGGQLQRVMIAMAISCKPKVLIADEPTTALDVTVQKSIIQLLKKLNEENGNSTIFITHDLGVIKEIADKVMVMYQGEVKEFGTIDQIFNAPNHSYTKGLLACRPPMSNRYKRLPQVDDFLSMNANEEQGYLSSLVETNAEFDQRIVGLQDKPVLLEARNLKKTYVSKKNFWGKTISEVKAVNDVSFQLREGECLGLVGESGCGKSTLARLIMQLEKPDEGEVFFREEDLSSKLDKEIRKLRKEFQIIFQDPYSSLNPRMRIGSAILEPMKVHGLYSNDKMRKEKVVELLEKVGLQPDHYDRYPHQFSGGQRQRISIARALSVEPKFILCDESVSALDVSIQAQVLNLLLDLKDEFSLSYLFISHDLSVVKFFADHVIVMEKGQIVEYGDVEQVITSPSHPYTKRLIDSIPW